MLISPINQIMLQRSNQFIVKIAPMLFACFFEVLYDLFWNANRCFDQFFFFLFRRHRCLLLPLPVQREGRGHATSRCTLTAICTYRAREMLAFCRLKRLIFTLIHARFQGKQEGRRSTKVLSQLLLYSFFLMFQSLSVLYKVSPYRKCRFVVSYSC